MTTTQSSVRSRARMPLGADGAGWPHVGDCRFGIDLRIDRMVKHSNGSRVPPYGKPM